MWNAPSVTMASKQRLTRVLIEEVVIDLDHEGDEVVVTIHWVGGRHSETRVPRVRTGRYPSGWQPIQRTSCANLADNGRIARLR